MLFNGFEGTGALVSVIDCRFWGDGRERGDVRGLMDCILLVGDGSVMRTVHAMENFAS